jgi:hypothetical protein
MNPQELRKQIHQLVDRLPEDELPAVRRVLEGLQAMGDPVLRALLRAPEEDEPVSEEERTALREAEEDVRQGDILTHEEMKDELGL